MLIVLEGLDGAGKSTQVKLLKEHIQNKGLKLEYLHFPRFDAPVYGDLIAKFLRGDFGAIDQVHPQLVALLFAEDRRDAAKQIREWLADGRCVLLDRYVYSNIAYQCSKIKDKVKAKELRDWIFELEYNIYDIPRPDVNLFLDVPISFVDKKLKENREGDDREYLKGKEDIHEASIQFQIDVRELYLEQTVLDSDFVRVECSGEDGQMLPPSDIFANIEKALEPHWK
ncbi:MAG: dTMP kinase [Bacteroidales bacterium]|nr:dTMP kinase [Bacteroidales bacterium]